jgi:NAD(P)H-hydrate repair Nnr-like enzyme with NAD(P)H-hydrate dehydratase domain
MPQRFGIRDAAEILQAPTTNDSKYTRGVVGLMTGSARYPGAAVLGASAAAQSGAGYVRYVGPDVCGQLVLERQPEVVLGLGSADAWAIGSGMDGVSQNDPRARAILALLDPASSQQETAGLERGDVPAIRVVDAGALTEFVRRALAARSRNDSPDSSDSPETTNTAEDSGTKESREHAEAPGETTRNLPTTSPALARLITDSARTQRHERVLAAETAAAQEDQEKQSVSGSSAQESARPSQADRAEQSIDTSHPLPGILRFNAAGYNGFSSQDPEGFLQRSRAVQTRAQEGARRPSLIRTQRVSEGTGNRRLYVITPHSGELARILRLLGDQNATHESVEEDRLAAATRVRDALGCTVVLKGAHTLIVPEHGETLEVAAPTYWLASAGTGDVLAGVMAAILGQLKIAISTGRVSLSHAVALAVFLHGYAGGIASGTIDPSSVPMNDQLGMAGNAEVTGHPLTALRVAQALPQAVGAVLAAGQKFMQASTHLNLSVSR